MAGLAVAPSPPLIVEVFDVGLSQGEGSSRTPILDGVSFKIFQGQFVVIVGPSGAGKSTLLRVIAGLVRPDKGDVYIKPGAGPDARPLGFVFQDALLMPWRSAQRNVEFGLEGLPITRRARFERAQQALRLVGLQDHADKWPRQLSGGERQRAGLARALAIRPSLLLMDEPFSALDPGTRTSLQDELLDIWSKTGTTILFITHDMNEATYLADRVLVLSGRPASIAQDIVVQEPRPRTRVRSVVNALADQLTHTFSSQPKERRTA